jgi:hypothetical protein
MLRAEHLSSQRRLEPACLVVVRRSVPLSIVESSSRGVFWGWTLAGQPFAALKRFLKGIQTGVAAQIAIVNAV